MRTRAKRRRSKPHLNSLRWQRLRLYVLRRDNWTCAKCGGEVLLEVHHIQEVAAGADPFDPDNLEVLCRNCHIVHHRFQGNDGWADFVNELL